MTVEVGVVTGELTLKTEAEGNEAVVWVQYKDADEWYTVARVPLDDPLQAVHNLAVAILDRSEG